VKEGEEESGWRVEGRSQGEEISRTEGSLVGRSSVEFFFSSQNNEEETRFSRLEKAECERKKVPKVGEEKKDESEEPRRRDDAGVLPPVLRSLAYRVLSDQYI